MYAYPSSHVFVTATENYSMYTQKGYPQHNLKHACWFFPQKKQKNDSKKAQHATKNLHRLKLVLHRNIEFHCVRWRRGTVG